MFLRSLSHIYLHIHTHTRTGCVALLSPQEDAELPQTDQHARTRGHHLRLPEAQTQKRERQQHRRAQCDVFLFFCRTHSSCRANCHCAVEVRTRSSFQLQQEQEHQRAAGLSSSRKFMRLGSADIIIPPPCVLPQARSLSVASTTRVVRVTKLANRES